MAIIEPTEIRTVFLPAVTVIEHRHRPTRVEVDWGDSYSESYVDGEEDPSDPNNTSEWLDALLGSGDAPSRLRRLADFIEAQPEF